MVTDAHAFAGKWCDACNSHDLERISALYSESAVFKSPRVCTVAVEPIGGVREEELRRSGEERHVHCLKRWKRARSAS